MTNTEVIFAGLAGIYVVWAAWLFISVFYFGWRQFRDEERAKRRDRRWL